MKKTVLLVSMFLLCFAGLQAQTFNDYVLEMRGDTAVIKDYLDMGNVSNSLFNAIDADASAPAGRVYMLKEGGLYFNSQGLTQPDRPIKIVGESFTPIVQSSSVLMPPILCGTTPEGGGGALNGDLITYTNYLLLKNLIAMPAATDNTRGWTFLTASSAGGYTAELDNVLMEHTRWVLAQSNNSAGNDLIIKNSYFVNLSGEPCRRNGGVYDNVSYDTDTMWVENTTHVMAQGMLYKFRGYPVTKAFFNHNTFVNCSGLMFETFGYQSAFTVTNNLFVNSHAQAYRPGLDYGETDQDSLPTGIINVDVLPEGMTTPDSERKVLADRNGIFWDAKLDEIVTRVQGTNGFNNWIDQKITMNSRTQSMFDNNTQYPKLVEGAWIMGGDPVFADPKNLMGEALDSMISYAVAAGNEDNGLSMWVWRTPENPVADNFVYPDWPVPVDLSYSNTQYLTAGLNGFPLGDLNWFPAEKTAWDAQRTSEIASLEAALNSGTLPSVGVVETVVGPPAKFQVSQNYPNPFNPVTTISFALPHDGNVTVKVYNALGKEVATLLNGYRTAQTYNLQFDASELSSGIYIYSVQFANTTITKKMTLLK